MSGAHQLLSIHDIELDRENPRIRRFLEAYEGELNDDRIALALDVAGEGAEGGDGATTPEKLRNSILANRGIMQPIIVNRRADGRLVCIEGNTRLYIYRQFESGNVEGNWSKIPALVHDNLESEGIDAIRLQAHLVGPRQWDAYSKAKFLWELTYKSMMPVERLVDLCGGDRRDVQRLVNAYADMEAHFRKLHEPGDYYDTERFSGFVELQSNKVTTAILKAGFSLDDFAEWLKDKRIVNLQEVRALPRVLSDKKARGVFLKKGVRAALQVLEQPETSSDLRNASLGQLARALTEKVEQLPFSELQRLRSTPDDDTVRHVLDAFEVLQNLSAEINAPS